MHTPGPAAGWVAGPSVLCVSKGPEQQPRDTGACGSSAVMNIFLAERPSASGVLRDSLKIPQPQTWHSAGSLCASEYIYGMPHRHPHRECLQTSVCTICNNVCMCIRKCKRHPRRPHTQRQMHVHTPCVPGPSVPISEDRLKTMITKAS